MTQKEKQLEERERNPSQCKQELVTNSAKLVPYLIPKERILTLLRDTFIAFLNEAISVSMWTT